MNGLVTNQHRRRGAQRPELRYGGSIANVTLMGIVKVAPDANSSLLVIDLRV
jgi:hypothetical protein